MDADIVSPDCYDFFLCSHFGIQIGRAACLDDARVATLDLDRVLVERISGLVVHCFREWVHA